MTRQVIVALTMAVLVTACGSTAESEPEPAAPGADGTGAHGGAGGSASGPAQEPIKDTSGPADAECGEGHDDAGCPCEAGAVRSCFAGAPELAGVGLCALGEQRCELTVGGEFQRGTWGPCEGEGSPSEEICGDELDNDCDGEQDETCGCQPGDQKPCSSLCGNGWQSCDQGAWGACTAPEPSPEVCNQVDDDCDGEVDESLSDCGATDPSLSYGSCAAPCAGAEHILYNATYDKWIKIVLCTPSRYDLFMGEAESGPFYKIGDTAGHGQDHCELVNPAFTLSHEDGVNSGSCPTCAVQHAGSVQDIPSLWGTQVYYRAVFGEPFTFAQALNPAIHTSCWYECGVSFQ